MQGSSALVSSPLTGDALADQAEAALAAEDLGTAVAWFNQAEPHVRDADRCAGGRWMAHMLGGDFEAAWRESDAIRRRGAPDPHRFWNGEALQGRRLMVRSLHGFGDAVQMFRFLPRLQAVASELIVEVPPKLMSLAPCFDGMGQVITWGEDAPTTPPAWDVQMEVMELPYALRVNSPHLAPTEGYLRVPASERSRIKAVFGTAEKPRVGLVWSAGDWNPARSVPFAVFRSLLRVSGVEFWSLQGQPAAEDLHACIGAEKPRDVYACGDGILALAAAVEQMDLVITVDTLAAHLAGALGVPCWLLLQHRADWRWMIERDDTPWYRSLRLLRQAREGNWQDLMQVVQRDLERYVSDGMKKG